MPPGSLQLFIAPLMLALVVFGANATEAALGFGGTIVAVALGASLYPLEFLVPTLVPLNVLVSLYIAVRHRADIDGHILWRRILPLTLAGLPLGLAAFTMVHSYWLKAAFGILVVGFSSVELVRATGNQARAQLAATSDMTTETTVAGGKAAGMAFGPAAFWLVGGGVMQGLYASGGPMVVSYASRELRDKASFRSTLSALWTVLTLVMTVSYTVTGRITRHTLSAGLMLLPVMLAGIVAGERLHGRVNERSFRALVFSVLLVAGVSLIVSAIQR